jgi:hypothetical protein
MSGDCLPIEIKLVRSDGYVHGRSFPRQRCGVCGAITFATPICAKSEDPKFLVCERCLRSGDINARLMAHARELEASAAYIRNLLGRLCVPPYEEWQAANERQQWLDNLMFGITGGVEDRLREKITSRETLIEAVERYHPDFLPLSEEEIATWLAVTNQWEAEQELPF